VTSLADRLTPSLFFIGELPETEDVDSESQVRVPLVCSQETLNRFQ
jgi:hypothetical protein